MKLPFFRVLSFLIGAILAAGLVTALTVKAVDELGVFELDGNAVDDISLMGDDWNTPPDSGSAVAFTGILADPPPLSIFTGGGSKDVNDVSEWRYTEGSSPPKDEITNAYAAAYINTVDTEVHNPGDLIITFGLDRFANNGDAFAGFWFFQDQVGLGANGEFVGNHMVGDILVLVEYPQGSNAMPEVKVYEWNPAEQDAAPNLKQLYSGTAECNAGHTGPACAITNHQDETAPWPYEPKFGSAGTFPFESFFEGGINVSALLGGDAPCFSSFLAETRSSRSETAQLKDFVLGAFDVCSIEVTKECSAEVTTEGDQVLVTFDGIVSNTGGLDLMVTVEDDMGTPNDTSDDKVVFGPQVIPAGESAPYSGFFHTSEISSHDVVIATGTRGSASVSATDFADCDAFVNEVLDVDKSCLAALSGDGTMVNVTFDGFVYNNGNTKLTSVQVVDDGGTPGDPSDDTTVNIGDLAPGASAPYSGSYMTTDISPSDMVYASATSALTGASLNDDASASCAPDVTPAIEVTKSCLASINALGDGLVVTFDGTVTNTGNEALTNVEVYDDYGNGLELVATIGQLNVGQSAPYSGSFNLSGVASSSDTAYASGNGLLSGSPVSDDEPASCAPDTLPAIEISKECIADINSGGTGIDVSFFGTVVNTGNVALTDVTVVDDSGTPGDTSDDVTVLGPITLYIGESANYSGSFGASGGDSTDIASVSANDALTGLPIGAQDDAFCAADILPAIAVTKECVDPAMYGDPITFSGTVTNTGNVALNNVTVVDDSGTPGDTSDDVMVLGPISLDIGASANYSGQYTVLAEGPSTDIALAAGEDAIEGAPVSAFDDATCVVPPPPGDEGCTPGYWKQENHFDSWDSPYYPSMMLTDAGFIIPNGSGIYGDLGSQTMLQALMFDGGETLREAAQILMRAAVASLLNAADSDVDFPLSITEVLQLTNDALASKDRQTMIDQAWELDMYNNGQDGCPLN
ncbi:hypothetical protein KQ940_07890 [Marinobacterium sp. D7]|uniref:DUF7507 domain-containing protein n=1 Tax=Marinobacterium ramblicola TaxID=2849041 RepID=UPI001C2DE8C8|nr:hypothetical protein [Marinobacterium ramblicola]MBV1787972.1 hypothetical protein [Marinobacterium ramblicola]